MELQGHERIDQRSLAMHRRIAEKLRESPSLLAIAEDNLARWMSQPGRSQPYLEAWQALLRLPIDELTKRIVEPSEWMTALRQSSPFAGVLSNQERWAILREYERTP